MWPLNFGNINCHSFLILFRQVRQVVQRPFIKQYEADSIAPLVTYNNRKMKDYFWLRYTSVVTCLTKVFPFEEIFSGNW